MHREQAVKHNAFLMNVSPPAGHLPMQNAVFCRQCSNDGRPKMIVKPSGAPTQHLVAFIRKHNGQYR
jgi:hypothetical protein